MAIETVYATENYFANRTANAVVVCRSRSSIDNHASFVTIIGASDNIISNPIYTQDVIINVTSGKNKISNDGSEVTINCSSSGQNTISNSIHGSLTAINAGSGNDSIYNESSHVTINNVGGDNQILNYGGSDVSIFSGNGNSSILSSGNSTTISAGGGNDTIKNYGNNVMIETGAGDDSIWNEGYSVTINTGTGNDNIINDGYDVSIFSGSGNNKVINRASYVTISTGDGNNTINNNNGSNVLINCSSGNDTIENTGSSVTIDAGAGNDKIYNGAAPRSGGISYYKADNYEGGFSNVVFKYGANSGNHTIWGFRENSTLEVECVEPADISYSPSGSGFDLNVMIGNARVSLYGSGPNGRIPISNLNIAVVKNYTLVCDVERNILDDLICDVERSVSSEINLFKTNTDDIFPEDTSEPVTISADITPDVSANINGLQSFTIQIAEQQITDQVTFTGIVPFNIMEYIDGQYFDYKYKLRIESVTQSGSLFTCHCCSDVDALLYELLGFEAPTVSEKYTKWHDANVATTNNDDEDDEDEENESYPYADTHLWNISGALNLEPVCQFNNFHSTVDINVAGVTYRDLIRSIFGWTARIPPHMINVFIRDNKIYAIQRGHEEHVIDISNAKISQPVFTRELVRTFWGETPYINTEVRTVTTYTTKPIYEGMNTALVQPLTSDTRQDSCGTTTINYSYDDDGMLIKTEEISPTSRTVTTHKYSTGATGNKFLVAEETTVYDLDGEQIDYRSVKHSPTNYGQAAVTAGNGESQNIVSTVKNVPYDERPTPYAIGQQLQALVTEPSGSKRQERLVPGIVPYDTSFPVADDELRDITPAIKSLNRKTQETATLSLYDCPHVIDFNDRILLFGNEYFLVSNKVSTTPRVFHQQNLTLVRWIEFENESQYSRNAERYN